MHILVLSEHFLPSCGGSITWLYETYRRFGPEEVVVVACEHGDTATLDTSLPFKVERVSMQMKDWDPTRPESLRRYLKLFRMVQKSQRRYQAEQVHCMKVLPEGLIAWALWHTGRIPYVLYAHGEEIQMRLTSRKLAYLIPILYRGARVIIANSHHTKQLLLDIGVRSDRIIVIHPGVDSTAFHSDQSSRSAIRTRYNLKQSFILLTVGRLQRRKGQDMVIRALPNIKERIPNVAYMIVGSGEDTYLRDLAAALGVAERVVFVGPIRDDERAAYYSACDVFVMPNRQIDEDIEGFGMVFLEAAAAAKPVIGGVSGGTGEAIQNGTTGLRVDGENVEAISEAIMDLASNTDRAIAMGANGRKWVDSEFRWDSVVERTRQLTAHIAQRAC